MDPSRRPPPGEWPPPARDVCGPPETVRVVAVTDGHVEVIIGRERELAVIQRALARVPDGPIAVLIDGEAGIGKTSLWQRAVAGASERSYRVLRCQAAEAETMLSYAALGDLLATVTDEELNVLSDVQRHALDVALLRADAAVPADPRALATGFVALVTHLADQTPVLLAVDDVHWLDAASARALQFVFRRLPPSLGLLLARRVPGEEATPLGLDRSLPSDRVERVVPAALSLAGLQHLLASRLGARFSRPTLVRLHELSGGNPFYALEIGRELLRRGGEPAIGQPLAVPATLQELLAARIGALSPEARAVLLVSSALARPSVPVVEAGLGGTAKAAAGLQEAEEAGVIDVDREGAVRFTHPLLASTVYASASGARRRTMHGHLAEAATEEEERARHLALSATGSDEAAAATLEQAARGADRRGAQEAAAELLEEARRLTPPDHSQELARRTLAEASALLAAGDISRARELAEEATGKAAPGSLRARGLLLLGRISHVDRSSREAAEHLRRAAVEAGGDRRLRGRVHAMLAWVSDIDPARAAQHAEAALELLDADDDPGPLAFALMTKFYNDAQLGRGADRRLLDRGLELERRAVSQLGEVSIYPLIWFKCMDEFDQARARYRVEAEWARSRGDESWGAERLGQLAEIELRAGNTALAERYIDESCAALDQVGPDGPLAMPLRIRAMIDAHCGRIDRARATLAPLIEEFERTGDLWWAALCLSTLGFVEVTAGSYAACDGALTRMIEHLETIGVKDALAQRSEPDQIEALAALGAPDRARAVLARLEERGRRLPRRWISIALPRCRALTLAADGDLPAALEASVEMRSGGAGELPFDLGRNLLLKGQLHRRTKHKRAAAEDLNEALETFARLDAAPWAERATAELARVGVRASAPDELTATERRVAELAASGMTNRQVAEAAFMSPKTVEANLARAYRKLGISSRAELGARMGERGAGPAA